MVVQTTLEILFVFCEVITVAVTHRIANKVCRVLYSVQREMQRIISIIHKRLSMLLREKSLLFKAAVDCCDYISSNVITSPESQIFRICYILKIS